MAKTSYLTPPCMLCHKRSNIQVDEDCLYRWQHNRMHIQHAFPNLNAAERELIMTGTHPACWNALTKDIEDDDPF